MTQLLRSLLVLLFSAAATAAPVDYEKQILPILQENCYDCHDADKTKAALRVDQRPSLLTGGDSGLATIVPGHPEKSFLMEVVTGEPDPEMQMPPKGDPLSGEQIKLLETWIREGAEWPGQMDLNYEETTDLWSLQAVERPALPENAQASTPIDAFLHDRLAAKDLRYNAPAAPRALIRRAAIILTGLPPSPERVTEFVAAFEKDADLAYAALVEELLASPHFGERWAQHWLDVIRWAETNGSESNLYRKNAWTYRDYVIRAFNEDIPYDRFLQEQMAGDQMGVGEATGYLVAGPHVPAATVGREESAIRQARADRMDEVVQTVSASALGMTVSCARCHNHKFDPISIADYYSLTAIFQGVEFGGRYPELNDAHPRQQRAGELYPELFKERRILREQIGFWQEDRGGFAEFAFPAATTKAIRVDFFSANVGVDELELFGPEEYSRNLARDSTGAVLKTESEKSGNEVWKANDGQYGTMAWRTDLPKGSKEKPYVEVHFPEAREINRFRFSQNREYYFETDYLESSGNPYFPGYKISALQEDGTWKELGNSQKAKQLIAKNPEAKAALARLQDGLVAIAEEGPQHSFIGQFIEPVTTHVLHRGSPESPRDEVMPAGFSILDGDLGLDGTTPDPERRKAFAEWITRPEHPLTARVMVNRLWHHVFGTGLVPTTSDFGTAGAPASHPELLDWLAAEFVDPQGPEASPWSMKDMIRRYVLSDAFRQSSAPESAGLAADAGAALLWRFPPRRVEAEVIRDAIAQASGKLDPTLGGRSYRIHNVKKTYAQWEVVDNHGDQTWRRMIYQERMRRVDDQIFTAFDFPDCGQVRAKRPVSTTPLQALNLMNSPYVVSQSGFIAERARAEAKKSGVDPVQRVFELILARPPIADEAKACEGMDLALVARSLINSNEFAFLP